MQATSFQVENPAWLKVLLVLGTAFFVAFAVGVAWLAYGEPLAFLRVSEGFVALFFGCFAVVGMRLLKFLHYRLEVDESSVTIRSPQANHSFGWADLRLRDRHALQITEVRDREDNILCVVDWYARNARRLVQAHAQRNGQARS